jgi:hypothetical protein
MGPCCTQLGGQLSPQITLISEIKAETSQSNGCSLCHPDTLIFAQKLMQTSQKCM